MAQRGKHFTFGSPGTASPRMAPPRAWWRGWLAATILLVALLLFVGSPEPCRIDGLVAVDFLSVNVGGFSLFIKWNSISCRY